MARFKLTSDLLRDILAHVPEGFTHRSLIARRLRLNNRDLSSSDDTVARDGEYFYDPSMITLDELRELRNWTRPTLPDIRGDGTVVGPTIKERRAERERHLARLGEDATHIINILAASPGYYNLEENPELPGGEGALQPLLESGAVQQLGSLVYDPLRLSANTMQEVARRQALLPMRQQIIEFLQSQPGHTAPQQIIVEKFGADVFREAVSLGGLSRFSISLRIAPYSATWVRLKDSDYQTAQKIAAGAYEVSEDQWQAALEQSGDVARTNVREVTTLRSTVHAHTYTVNSAAKRLGLHSETIEAAARQARLLSFTDPEGVLRFPAYEIESIYADAELHEQIAGLETIKAREIALVGNLNYATLRRRLRRGGISRSEPYWEQVRGKWRLPQTLVEFRRILKDKLAEIRAKRALEQAEEHRLLETERQRRAELRERLVAAFPSWQHEKRQEQRVYLHIGPPNSGKTHDALTALSAAGEGWYLAPLRLLAFEIFDRLNQRGVPCSLLTGEEYIPVEGAQITSATVEMFNPNRSGQCVIVDEAQMLADPDRGWAWTRALMEAQAPRIHVIGPPTVRALIERMSEAAAIPLTLVKHERLAPVEVAERNWPLRELKPRTILVAFSRQAVLELKTELEQAGRSVSVIYGSLPPEVRRKQADRFADGQTEICVATDAVGMGLNLPADYVCFYEVKKYDGKQTRLLTPGAIQQIGGRAGRYGLSTTGEVGATTAKDLRAVRNLFYAAPSLLTHARVAPTVEDLEMIPGSLAERLAEWASLRSIPESLRGALEIADMSERIELASMLAEHEVEQLGLAAALQLVNAPTRQTSRAYWHSCARAILAGRSLPLPPVTRAEISDSEDLERLESSISFADIYLWLSHRKEFAGSGPEAEDVRQLRLDWSNAIDRALLKEAGYGQTMRALQAIAPARPSLRNLRRLFS